jgi:hypothetical protein
MRLVAIKPDNDRPIADDLVKLKKKFFWSKQYWKLVRNRNCDFHVMDGAKKPMIVRVSLYAGWITDKRSGSRLVDIIAPKTGNARYQWCWASHDASWSGWLSQPVSDELFVHQGFVFTGECSEEDADLAHWAVSNFGKAYDMDDVMPPPYTNNRQFEHISIEAK